MMCAARTGSTAFTLKCFPTQQYLPALQMAQRRLCCLKRDPMLLLICCQCFISCMKTERCCMACHCEGRPKLVVYMATRTTLGKCFRLLTGVLG
ncbi:unnamed protein product [Chrysoparadoxa australica]